MKISKIGFGSYRAALGNEEHYHSLKRALLGGVNLIDTSSNYTGGLSEELIGKVMKDLQDTLPRSSVIIVSKYGYIQGHNMDRYKKGFRTPETVLYDDHCYHCIHPDFMRDQLQRSLVRLQMDYIDIYLIHNPEYYLMHNVKEEAHKEKRQKIMLERISAAFEALEAEVKKGRIKEYGISSNSFSKSEKDLHFLPYKSLVLMAEEAAEKAGNSKHSLTTLQMPGNMLETIGLDNCAPWAAKAGLKVLINRPLNAYDEKGLHRLASYELPLDTLDHMKRIIDRFIELNLNDTAQFLASIAAELHLFKSIDHYDYVINSALANEINFHLQNTNTQNGRLIMNFFYLCSQFVRAESSNNTKMYLREKGYEIEDYIEKEALKYLLNNPNVTAVLLGMKRTGYVDTALDLLKENSVS